MHKTNETESNKMIDEVKMFLKYFEKAYQKRNISDLDEFMDIFFSKDECYVLGTSTQEIFPNFEMAKSCVKNDWLYWGTLSINDDHPFIKTISDDLLVHVNGSVTYTFEDQDEVDENFVGLMQTLNDEADSEDVNHLNYQHHEMTYILDHYLSRRKNDKRMNQVPLSMTFLLKYQNDALKIIALSYDVPTFDDYPDVVIHPYTPYQEQINHDIDTLHNKGKKLNVNPFGLTVSEDFIFIDTNGHQITDRYEFEHRLEEYDKLDLIDHALIHETKDYMSFMTIGKSYIKQDEQTLRQKLQARISNVIESDLDDQSKLFKIRRIIALTDKMIALGSLVQYPVKIMGIISKHEDIQQLSMIKMSYPMDIILEDKYI
jgi:hypothetical protein